LGIFAKNGLKDLWIVATTEEVFNSLAVDMIVFVYNCIEKFRIVMLLDSKGLTHK